MGTHVKTWHQWIILASRWEWGAAHRNKEVRVLQPVMDCSGPSKPWERSLHVQERLSVVLAGWGYSSYSQCDPGVAQSAIPTNIGQSTLRSWAEIQIGLHIHLTWFPPPRLLLMEVLEGSCIWEQAQDNPWTILLAVFKYASSGAVDIWSTYYNVLWK